MFDVIIQGPTVIDGTGSAGQRADIGVTKGRITAIGDLSAHGGPGASPGRGIRPKVPPLGTAIPGQLGPSPAGLRAGVALSPAGPLSHWHAALLPTGSGRAVGGRLSRRPVYRRALWQADLAGRRPRRGPLSQRLPGDERRAGVRHRDRGILFGSDYPVSAMASELCKVRLLADLAPEDESAMLGGNCLRLFEVKDGE